MLQKLVNIVEVKTIKIHIQVCYQYYNNRRSFFSFLGSDDIPDPVCAAAKVWTGEASAASHHMPKVGVDHNSLHWRSLKPFDNADVFIIGDVFSPYTENGSWLGWTEGALLTAERVLYKHFDLSPYVPSLVLEDQWSTHRTAL